MSNFEPILAEKIEIANAKEYGLYFKVSIKGKNPWHIVGEAYSFIEVGDKKILKIFPFYAIPIQLRLESKESIIFLNK